MKPLKLELYRPLDVALYRIRQHYSQRILQNITRVTARRPGLQPLTAAQNYSKLPAVRG